MLPSTILLTVFSLLSLSYSKITIGKVTLGDDSYVLAWNSDENACDTAKVLAEDPNSPCGHAFSVKDYSGATLEGCGGPLWINVGGQFKHNCRLDNQHFPTICPNPGGSRGEQLQLVHQEYTCE